MGRLGLAKFREDEELCLHFKELIETEYLETFMKMKDFCKEHDITPTAFRFIMDRYGLSKDMSRFNNSKKPEVVAKIAQTKMERYGDSRYNNMEKNRATTLAHHGVEHALQSDKFKAKAKATFESHYAKGSEAYRDLIEGRAKVRSETLKTLDYGELVRNTRARHMREDPNWLEKSNQKREETCISTYGVSNVSKLEEVKELKSDTLNKGVDDFMKQNDCVPFTDILRDYGRGWLRELYKYDVLYYKRNRYLRRADISRIEEYNKLFEGLGTSHGEQDVKAFIESIYDGTVLGNCRSVIHPKELDIYIPDKHLAIEFDGIFWHSNKMLSPTSRKSDYHLKKTLACEKKGIRLIHIFEDQWYTRNAICKSILSSAFGIYKSRIYARNCDCRAIGSKEYREFLDENHIQGAVNSSIRLGLFHEGELVQVAGWGKSRFKKGELELHRMCTKMNTQVIGGFSKLIAHSGIDHFISYVDRSLYTGKGYEATGFKVVGDIKPSYFYSNANDFNRINRISAQKHKLPKLLPRFDENLTEENNMFMNGYFKIYDCGNLKMEYRKEAH